MAESDNKNLSIPTNLPVIPLKNVVLFPRVAIPLLVQRPKSVNSLDEAMETDKLAIFVAQKNIFDDVDHKDLFTVGTVGKIFEVHKLPDGPPRLTSRASRASIFPILRRLSLSSGLPSSRFPASFPKVLKPRP
ncbi:MAG: LON peptidase substrate-binding domain-containing protein [Patescibacteria group bacterium]